MKHQTTILAEKLVEFGQFAVNLAQDAEVGVLFEILMRCGASDIWPCLALFFIGLY
jgi:hypothetical protein